MTVGELIEELQSLPEDLPVHVHDLADGEHFPIELVDPTISDRVELNFNSETMQDIVCNFFNYVNELKGAVK